MNVLVMGGTRGLGRAVVVAAHGAGHVLTAMARNAGGFASPVTGVRMVVGDAGDAADVERAMAGQHAVVWAVAAPPGRRDAHVLSRGTALVLAAMARHGVRRLVCVTCAGEGAAARRGLVAPLFSRALAEDTRRQEAAVRASAAEWIVVRPAALKRGAATGLYRVLTEPTPGPHKRIARADVAEFIVANLDAPDFVRATVLLAG
ncbi:MAG: NAD(P)-binding oxidoreductase [Burkholderiales bacterium]